MFGGERFDRAVGLLDAVDKVGGKGVAQGMQTSLFNAGCLEDAVEQFAEVNRSLYSRFSSHTRGVFSTVPANLILADRPSRLAV